MTTSVAPTARERFQALLRELFQFDRADLDFGIYRIMNHKRAVVDGFIVHRLPADIDAALNQGPLVGQAQAEERREAAARQVRKNLGKDAINRDGELDARFQDTPAGRAYLAAQADAASGRSRAAVETEIYNHLYAFFRRYYRDGDFIAQRRYSASGDTYAIPYNGQEVFLHWANREQYYVKTAEHFLNYDWKAANDVKVQFRLDAVDVERNNAKGERRFFMPQAEQRQWDDAERILTIPVEYRPLTDAEKQKQEYGGGGARQDKINTAAATEIIQSLHDNPAALAALTHVPEGAALTALETHLRRYAARNNADFFIHKDLSKFLTRELDFYLKNEALKLDTLLAPGSDGESAAVPAAAALQQARLIKAIGGKIIDFLGQLEGFQKSLWEKRKFVTQTAYCITLNAINPSFYPEIAANAAQGQEWRNLGFVDESVTPGPAWLRENPTLPLDTRHFDRDFTDRLLASFADLDAQTDGILIHGDNWQALRLLEETYQGRVKAVYIDPPYNAPSSEIIYKNGYKHSTYLSMLTDRVSLSRSLMQDDAVHAMAIDENEHERAALLLKSILPDMAHTTVSIVHNPSGQQGDNFSYSHDYTCFAYNPQNGRQIGEEIRADNLVDIRNFRDVTGPESVREAARNCFYPIFVRDGNIVGFGDVCPDAYHPGSINLPAGDGAIAVYPIDPKGVERKWRFARQTVEQIAGELFPHFLSSRKVWDIRRRKKAFNFKTVWTDPKYFGNNHGTQLLNHLFGGQVFDYPKSIYTVMDCLRAALNGQTCGVALDYFAGSGTTGHAVINLNRGDENLGGADDPRRRFILVEQGEYFDTVLLPRIKKATYAPEWAAGKPKRPATAAEAERSPRIVKYLRLESYEDALDSVDFDERAGELALEQLGEDYLLKYLLNWETKDSPTKLKTADLATPFRYRLRGRERGKLVERCVDLGETFNWLLGLRVQSRQVYQRDGRRYLVYRGEIRAEPGQLAAVIWRETAGWTEWDYAADRAFIIEQQLAGGAAILYLNSGAAAPQAGCRAIEPLFKARMFAGVTGR